LKPNYYQTNTWKKLRLNNSVFKTTLIKPALLLSIVVVKLMMYTMVLFFRLQLNQLDFFGQFRNRLEEILFEAVIRDLENRSLGIRVDGNNHLRVLHSAQVLYGTRNSTSDVKVRCDYLARLAYLPVVGAKSGVDRRTGGTDGRLFVLLGGIALRGYVENKLESKKRIMIHPATNDTRR
jgi:hypothetical protein